MVSVQVTERYASKDVGSQWEIDYEIRGWRGEGRILFFQRYLYRLYRFECCPGFKRFVLYWEYELGDVQVGIR